MATLRERQKERRHSAIMDAAWEVFGQKGLDETSVEEIAARAEVGTATVYAYFSSKNDLLAALLVQYVAQQTAAGEDVLKDPPSDIVDGMSALFNRYLEGMVSHCGPYLLREFSALAMSRRFDYGRDAYELRLSLMDQAHQLVIHYKKLGQIREDATTEEAMTLCYSAALFPMMLFALGLGTDLQTARRTIRRRLTLALAGIGQHDRDHDKA